MTLRQQFSCESLLFSIGIGYINHEDDFSCRIAKFKYIVDYVVESCQSADCFNLSMINKLL